jgi:hypothetical protein
VVSSQRLTGDGQQPNAVRFSWPGGGASGCVGLDATDPGTSCAEIPYRLVLQPYQGGLLATGYDGDTYAGDITLGPGDEMEIAILGGHVTSAGTGTASERPVHRYQRLLRSSMSTPPARRGRAIGFRRSGFVRPVRLVLSA